MISVKHPNYLNYGHSEGEVSIFKKRRIVLLMSLAIMMVLTGVAFGIGFGYALF